MKINHFARTSGRLTRKLDGPRKREVFDGSILFTVWNVFGDEIVECEMGRIAEKGAARQQPLSKYLFSDNLVPIQSVLKALIKIHLISGPETVLYRNKEIV